MVDPTLNNVVKNINKHWSLKYQYESQNRRIDDFQTDPVRPEDFLTSSVVMNLG